MCGTTIDFRRGDRYPHIVLMGACPGQEEFDAEPERPFAGRSGENLEALLTVLRDLPDKERLGLHEYNFETVRPDDYTLMNSHPAPKWYARDRKTTPTKGEVSEPQNIQRIRNQFQSVNARLVIGLGRPVDNALLVRRGKDSCPMRAIRILAPELPDIIFLITGHPSPRAINTHGNGDPAAWFGNGLTRFPVPLDDDRNGYA